MSTIARTFNDGKTKAQIVTSDGAMRIGGNLIKGASLFTLGAIAVSGAPIAGVMAALAGGMVLAYGFGAAMQAEGTKTVPPGKSKYDVKSNTSGFLNRTAKFLNPRKF